MFFFFNDTATTEIYTLSLHDALPICLYLLLTAERSRETLRTARTLIVDEIHDHGPRSEEHTSELQSRPHLVCRLLLEKKKVTTIICEVADIQSCYTVDLSCSCSRVVT